jgi:hypothetical protein
MVISVIVLAEGRIAECQTGYIAYDFTHFLASLSFV